MNYNTQLPPLIIPEYGRHIHRMANSLLDIESDEKRNEQAQVLINIMGNLNPHFRDIAEYKHKLWDHLFIMCEHKLNIQSPYPRPTMDEGQNKIKMHNTQGSVKNKHYGKLILLLIEEATKINDKSAQQLAFEQIAKQMKRAYLNWNQANVQDTQIWSDLERFAEKKLNLDTNKVIPVFQPSNRKKTFYKKPHKKNYSKK